TCYKLYANAPFTEFWEKNVEFAKPHKRLSTYYRKMNRAVLIDQLHDPLDQLLAFIIADSPERLSGPYQVIRFIRITTRTAQRTFPRDLYRQRRILPREYLSPGLDQVGLFHPRVSFFSLWAKFVGRHEERVIRKSEKSRYSSNRLNIRHALVPPKPKLFERTYSTSLSRGAFGM